MEYLIRHKGATTTEMAKHLKPAVGSFSRDPKEHLNQPIIEYYAGSRSNKKKAWWISKEPIQRAQNKINKRIIFSNP